MKADPPLRMVPMRPVDLNEILSIERRSFAAPWTREMYFKEMSRRAGRALVFKMGEEIVGYLCFWAVLDEAHLQTIAVRPERRGRGIGKSIMSRLEAICLRDGLKRIILEVGRRNIVARNLYKTCGFESIGFRKQYYKEVKDDALVMEKWLGSRTDRSHPTDETDSR